MAAKIINHPDKDIIIDKMLSGESVRSIEAWLKSKYPKNRKLHVSYPTLQSFRKEHLNIKGEVLDDIKEVRAAKDEKEREKLIEEKVKKSTAYKDKLAEVVKEEIDVSRRLIEMEALVNSRLEYYFNALQSDKAGIREDKVFLEYVNVLRGLLSDWKKFIEGHTDKSGGDININIVMGQITIIKNIVGEVIAELQPELVPTFIEKVNSKLDLVDYEEEIEKGLRRQAERLQAYQSE